MEIYFGVYIVHNRQEEVHIHNLYQKKNGGNNFFLSKTPLDELPKVAALFRDKFVC